MNTEEYTAAANVNGKVSKSDIMDGKDNIGDLSVFLPTVEFARSLPDSALATLITLAGKHVLQHGGSQALRSTCAAAKNYPAAVRAWEADQKLPEGERKGVKKPDAPGEPEREIYLAEWIGRIQVSRDIQEKADGMLDQLTKGGDTINARFIAGAKQYGLTGWPDVYGDVTRDMCIRYQQAKKAFVQDLA